MIEMLRGIRQRIGSGKIAVFWDNAPIHTAHRLRAAAASDDIKIELAFNAAYRPDCNGIEYVWGMFKSNYRRFTDNFKARNVPYDNRGLIEYIQTIIPNDKVINCARRGWQNLLAALPVEPLEHEEQPILDWNLQLRAGPERYYGDVSISD